MNTPLSAKHAAINVPLSSQEQWENFVTHHCGEWRGLLLRYDKTGRVLDVLDSVRRLIPSEDRATVTHALDFRSRMTKSVRQKQWVLTLGNPLITHPVDPVVLWLGRFS